MTEFETELKFRTSPDNLVRVKEDPTLAAKTAYHGGERRLSTTYYDSPKRKLHDKGATLRIRTKDGQFIQTAKAEGDRGGLVRPEFEEEITSGEPDLTHLKDTSFGPLINKALKDGPLQPIFTTDILRETRLLVFPGGTRIEIAFDQGEIIAGDKSEPICEIELELKAGSAATLFSVAQSLSNGHNLALSLPSKAERGMALVIGKGVRAVKAEPLILPPKIAIGEALAHITGACLKHLSANEESSQAGQMEGIHQMRVALRRFRSALKIFTRVTNSTALETLEETARSLALELGEARDLDVFTEEILEPALQHIPASEVLDVLLQAVARRRQEAWVRATHVVEGAVYRDFVLNCAELAVCGPAGLGLDDQCPARVEDLLAPLRPFAEEVLKNRYKKVRRRGRKLASLTPVERHELRKDLKKLRYSAEFFSSLFSPKDQQKFFGSLKTLQDDLGYLNDVATARILLEDICAGLNKENPELAAKVGYLAGEIAGWHMSRADDATSDLREEWASLEKTTKFWQSDR